MNLRFICKSKIHRATITGADIDYIGSIAIDEDLLRHADIVPGEKVCVWDVSNGERLETYAIVAERGSGIVAVNGAAAHKIRVGDIVIIAAFALTDEVIVPRMLSVDSRNRFLSNLSDNTAPLEPLPLHLAAEERE